MKVITLLLILAFYHADCSLVTLMKCDSSKVTVSNIMCRIKALNKTTVLIYLGGDLLSEVNEGWVQVKVMYKPNGGRYRQIFWQPLIEVCEAAKTISQSQFYPFIKAAHEKYAPDSPTQCPVPPKRYQYNFTMNVSNINPKNYFWGNFAPPNGLYKFNVRLNSTKDPIGGGIEWVTEIKNRMGDIEW